MNQRHWKEPEYSMLELIADILIEQGYATRKMTAGYIAPAAGGLCEVVSPFYSSNAAGKILTGDKQVDDPLRELIARKQCDAIENWLHDNRKDLLQFCKNNLIGRSIPYDGNRKRADRIKWCLNKLAENKQ